MAMNKNPFDNPNRVRRLVYNDVSGDLIEDGRGGFVFTDITNLGPHMIWTKYGVKALAEQILAIAEEMEA